MKKLAIVTSHPIQYNAPWFRLLSERKKLELKVFYTWSQAQTKVKDKTFGRTIQWDIPLLEGYDYEVVENVAKEPGSHHFKGINCPDLIRKLKAFQPDAILVFGWNFKSNLKVLRNFKGKVPLWFRGDSTLLDETPGLKTFLRRLVLRWVYSHVDKAFYVGSANKDYYLKHGLKESQLVYAPHTIDNDRFGDDTEKQYQAKADKWRQDLGIHREDLVVIFAGKFETKKQPDLLIDAVIEANSHRAHPMKLVLVGNGPLEEDLKEKAKGHDFITFIPFQNQSQMPVVYRLGDVYCLPSKGPGETWGLAVNEAMASGRPVIVSDKMGCASDLVNESTGWMFPVDQPESLQKILVGLEKKELETRGTPAHNFVQNWSFERLVSSLEHSISTIQ